MAFFLIVCVIVAALVLASIAVVAFFNSGAQRAKVETNQARNELLDERERLDIALNGLREIAAGSEMPVIVAGDTLNEVNRSYRKEIA